MDWHALPARELRIPTGEPAPVARVIACLSIWNDLPALRETLPTWWHLVDGLICIDGPYAWAGCDQAESNDGLRAWLAQQGKPVQYEAGVWIDQAAKRSAYLQHPDCQAGDVLFIVDADEYVEDLLYPGEMFSGMGDVGWVAIESPYYRRAYGQPRLLRWQPGLRYQGRHHWIYAGGHLLATHQYGGTGFAHSLVPLRLRNRPGLEQSREAYQQELNIRQRQFAAESQARSGASDASDRDVGGRESLRILQVMGYDPGLVAFRLHTAINTSTPHASAMLRRMDDNPFEGPTQFDSAKIAPAALQALVESADVLHCHLDYRVAGEWPDEWARPQATVIHHHGTMLRMHPEMFDALDRPPQGWAQLRLVSNLDLLQYAPDAKWLPNPVPVGHYQRLRALAAREMVKDRREFWIAHSPSKRHLKGTDAFLAACEALRRGGIKVRPVLIEGQPLAESLRLKALCDACFDSFFLGIQCSGLEAAAMGLPVIAGDAHVWSEYQRLGIERPYLFADTPDRLEAVLWNLICDKALYQHAARSALAYARQYHDEPAVALRYLDLLDEALGWRKQLALEAVRERDEVRLTVAPPPLTWQPLPLAPAWRDPQLAEAR